MEINRAKFNIAIAILELIQKAPLTLSLGRDREWELVKKRGEKNEGEIEYSKKLGQWRKSGRVRLPKDIT